MFSPIRIAAFAGLVFVTNTLFAADLPEGKAVQINVNAGTTKLTLPPTKPGDFVTIAIKPAGNIDAYFKIGHVQNGDNLGQLFCRGAGEQTVMAGPLPSNKPLEVEVRSASPAALRVKVVVNNPNAVPAAQPAPMIAAPPAERGPIVARRPQSDAELANRREHIVKLIELLQRELESINAAMER